MSKSFFIASFTIIFFGLTSVLMKPTTPVFAQACTGTLKCDTWNGIVCGPPLYGVSCSISGCSASCTKPACQVGGGKCSSGGGGGGSCARVCEGTNCNKIPAGCTPVTNSECTSDCDCGGPCPSSSPSPSCTITLSPDPASISVSSTQVFTASVVPADGTVSQVDFLSNNTAFVTVSPASDTTSAYETTATGVAEGSTTVRAGVIMGGAERCSDTANITVIPPSPWWQAIDADIFSSGGISSEVPASQTLILDGTGGFPGVATYLTSLNIGNGTLSSTAWGTNTAFNERRIYNYALLARQIPSDVVMNEIVSPVIDGSELVSGGAQSRGYYWYHFDGSLGDLTITGDITIAGDRKVVLLLDGANLILNGEVRIGTKGAGFFMALAGKNESGNKGDIVVDETVGGAGDGVPELEGIFLADGTFSSGTAGVDLDTQLHIRGSVAAYGGATLQRDLVDDSATPAELFEFAPELLLLYPPSLGVSKFSWEEVAP